LSEITLLVADYAALEVVVLADLTLRLFGDDQLAKSVQPGAPDIHSVNAKYIWGTFLGWTVPASFNVDGKPVLCTYAGQPVDTIPVEEFKKHPYGAFLRGNTKTTFYGWCYGKRGYGFSTLSGADGKPIGEELGDKLCVGLLKAMPGLGKWERWVEAFVDAHHGIYSLDGRWCDLSAEMETGEDWQRRRAYRRALNYPCQATGAGIIGDAMVRVRRCPRLGVLGYRTILNVHDEIVMRGPLEHVAEAEELLKKHMTEATANGTHLLIPLQVSVGHGANYFEAK
jgi:DNA polymerase I-like protein with 3'-5' exonuclease and polymerase domains